MGLPRHNLTTQLLCQCSQNPPHTNHSTQSHHRICRRSVRGTSLHQARALNEQASSLGLNARIWLAWSYHVKVLYTYLDLVSARRRPPLILNPVQPLLRLSRPTTQIRDLQCLHLPFLLHTRYQNPTQQLKDNFPSCLVHHKRRALW
jgi:hypothetical protein